MAKNRTLLRTCYLCGTSGKMTRDHVPPKGLFEKPRPNNLVTVPCCFKCNNGSSRDDEYFRLAMCLPFNRNDKGRSMWMNKLENAKFERIADLVAQMKTTIEPAKLILGSSSGFKQANNIFVDASRIESVLIRITKGLLYLTHPEIDRSTLVFEVTQIDQMKLDFIERSGVATNFTPYALGNGVYCHWRGLSNEDNGVGIWVHCFYGASCFIVSHAKDDEMLKTLTRL